MRDHFVFTNKRLILVDVQGVTGKRREYKSIPYRAITRFSVESAGRTELDVDLKIWMVGDMESSPLSRKVAALELARILAEHIA